MIQLNKEQEEIVQLACNHVLRPSSNQVFQYSGGPGTGKSTVIMEIIKRIGIPLEHVAVMAYIGQAASVLRSKGLYNAKTAHSWLYQLAEVEMKDENGNVIMDETFNVPKVQLKFVPKELEDISYIIIDEGYTFPERMKHEVERRGLPIIVCGDVDQLPPVKDKPAYLVDGEIHYLKQCMRQFKDSGIVYLANRILKGLPIDCGLYNEVLVIERKDLTDEMLKRSEMVLCGTNKTRDYYNNKIRHEILGIQSTMPVFGEKLICRKNNWNLELDGISLTNGLVGTVMNNPGVESYDGTKFLIDFKPNLINSCYKQLECNYQYFVAGNKERMLLKNSPYAPGEKFEPANIITTHLSQGAEYSHGIYMKEYLHKNIQKNLDYTGITRFRNYNIFVLPDHKTYYNGIL